MPLIKLLIIIGLTSTLFGCSSAPKTSFYQLKSIDTNQAAQSRPILKNVTILLTPIKFPEYLDRPQLITRKSDFKLYLNENHLWAEPLSNEFTRVLTENINKKLAPNTIYTFTTINKKTVDITININVLQFDVNANNEAVLIVKWNYSLAKNIATTMLSKTITLSSASKKQESRVAAQSQLIAQFSDYIIQTLFDLHFKLSH